MAGGAAAVAATAAGIVLPPHVAGAAATGGPYIWGLNPEGFVVPSDTWVKVPWPLVPLNNTAATFEPDGTMTFPKVAAQGIWAIVACLAWDNAIGPNGQPIAPRSHRKLARIPQQDRGTPQLAKVAYPVASTEIVYHAELAACGSQVALADGMRGYSQQQVYVQTGVRPDYPDQRIWIEVYQDSGIPLMCRFDGSNSPRTATRPMYVNYQAPSLMVVRVCDY